LSASVSRFSARLYNKITAVRLAVIFSAIAAMTGIYQVWPKSAAPEMEQLRLYIGGGSHNDFIFVCEFVAKNNGMGSCSVIDIKILLKECQIEMGHSLIMLQPPAPGSIIYPQPPGTRLPERTFSTELPVSIDKLRKEQIVIVGRAQSQTLQRYPYQVDVKVTFQTWSKTIVKCKTAEVFRGVTLNDFKR
jgi:hypothetical protein